MGRGVKVRGALGWVEEEERERKDASGVGTNGDSEEERLSPVFEEFPVWFKVQVERKKRILVYIEKIAEATWWWETNFSKLTSSRSDRMRVLVLSSTAELRVPSYSPARSKSETSSRQLGSFVSTVWFLPY